MFRSRLLPRSGVGVQPPWLVIAPQEPVIRVDLRMLDRVEVIAEPDGTSLLIALGDYEFALYIADGADACKALAAECSRYTRGQSDPVQDSSELEWTTPPVPDREQFVFVGSVPVLHRPNRIHIGDLAFRLDDIRHYALRGANVPLHNGGLVQAAVALLVAGDDAGLLAHEAAEEGAWLGTNLFTPAESSQALRSLDARLHDHELAAELVIGTERESASERVCGAFCMDAAGCVRHVSFEPPHVTRFVNGTLAQFAACLEALEGSGTAVARASADILTLRTQLITIDAQVFAEDTSFWPMLLRSFSA